MSSTAAPPTEAPAGYRYGVVLALVLAAVVVIIIAPDGGVGRAVAFGVVAAALLTVVVTSRDSSEVRRRRLIIGGAVAVVLMIAIAIGLIGRGGTFILLALATLAVPFTLTRGLLRLVRDHGVTTSAVAGALAIYLLVGLAFGSVITFVAAVGPHYFYAQGTNGTASDDLYYSFTVMTTTGFGDFTAAHGAGRAIAVIEMLVGQLYLVTVIGIIIGRRVGQAS